jgi:hypothetical protein
LTCSCTCTCSWSAATGSSAQSAEHRNDPNQRGLGIACAPLVQRAERPTYVQDCAAFHPWHVGRVWLLFAVHNRRLLDHEHVQVHEHVNVHASNFTCCLALE